MRDDGADIATAIVIGVFVAAVIVAGFVLLHFRLGYV
jgi:hypothetical protein